MKAFLKFLKAIYSMYAATLFVALMLVIFPFVLASSFFGRIKGGNMVLGLCRVWGDIWFPLIFIFQHKIFETPHDKKRAYIFVTNHISYLDAAMIPKAF